METMVDVGTSTFSDDGDISLLITTTNHGPGGAWILAYCPWFRLTTPTGEVLQPQIHCTALSGGRGAVFVEEGGASSVEVPWRPVNEFGKRLAPGRYELVPTVWAFSRRREQVPVNIFSGVVVLSEPSDSR